MTTRVTSKYWCKLHNHLECVHDIPPWIRRVDDVYRSNLTLMHQQLILSLVRPHSQSRVVKRLDEISWRSLFVACKKDEHFYQTALQVRTGLRHQHLKTGKITDLSDDNFLIEIKRGCHFRVALGQILEYDATLGSNRRHKIIFLFDVPEPRSAKETDLLNIYSTMCRQVNVTLVLALPPEHYVEDFARAQTGSAM